MGRRVVQVPLDTIHRFELTEIPYPLPFLRCAWLAVLFQNSAELTDDSGNPNSQNIWFIKLPLDEQGLLQQAARDDFLHRMLETMAAARNSKQQPSLDDNPYGFTPREDKMAVFHAKVARQLGESPSQFYSHARNYFTGSAGFDQWSFVGLQGIADITARLDEENNSQLLTEAIPHLPATPFAALCSCLENVELTESLSREIAARIHQALEAGDASTVAAGVRGLSNSNDHKLVNNILDVVLKHPAGQNVEVLATIAGRCWQALEDPELRLLFLESLARCEAGQQAFDSILADLLFLPVLKQSMKAAISNPARSERLVEAVESFLTTVQTTSKLS